MKAWLLSCVRFAGLLPFCLNLSSQRIIAQEAAAQATVATNAVWTGERVTLNVDLLAPGIFASAATFVLPTSTNFLLLPPAQHPVVGSREVNGTNYTVQSHELAIFTCRAGDQTIPPLTITFQFKRHPLDKTAESATVQTEPVRFTVKLPPGAEHLGNVISARDLKLTETWQPQLEATNIKAGDAFTRTITFTAPEVPGMVFPPFPAGEIDGIGIYPKPSEILDNSERSSMQGKRRDTITYVCERAGRFVIPATELIWFDLESQQFRTNQFPVHTFNVQSNPALAAKAATTNHNGSASASVSSRQAIKVGAGGMLILVLLAAFLWKTWRFWVELAVPLRSVSLAPLNPEAAPAKKQRH